MSSEKFIQLNIPCKECLVGPICEDKKIIEQQIKEQKFFEFLLALKQWDETKKVYRKGLIEAWANMGWDIFSNMRSSEFKDLPNKISPEFIETLAELAATIQWIINSTSWQEGKKHDFDKTEIKHKLEIAIGWI
jgi:hypothetical protein